MTTIKDWEGIHNYSDCREFPRNYIVSLCDWDRYNIPTGEFLICRKMRDLKPMLSKAGVTFND